MSDICGSQAAARSMQQLAREFSACRDMLVALGNENRQLIFVALLEHPGGVRVGDLAKLARLSRPATSHHLKVLQDAGLIDHYQQGTKNYYHASARLDRWAQLARVTAHAEQFVRLVQELDARAEAGKHACSESGSDLMSLLTARHSVRSFTDRPIEKGAVVQLQAEADALNERLGLSIQLCLDNPEAFDGRLAHYGSFRNVRNHIALVGPTRPGLDEACAMRANGSCYSRKNSDSIPAGWRSRIARRQVPRAWRRARSPSAASRSDMAKRPALRIR